MGVLKRIRAAFDASYPKDPNPENWRTINGAKTHINENGEIDGGAGGKFVGRKWTSEKHPHSSSKKPKVTVDDLKKSWAKVIAAQVNMKRAKSEATYKKQAAAVLAAIENYEKLKATAAEATQRAHNPKIELAKQSAARPYKKATVGETAGASALSALTSAAGGAGTPDNPFRIREAAKIAATPREADKKLRGKLERVWAKASESEKEAAFVYSYSFKQFQEPLRGIEYGTMRPIPLKDMPWDRLGVGRMDKKPGEVKGLIQSLTSFVDKSSYDEDITLCRGNSREGVAKLFGVSESLLARSSVAELKRTLLGREGKDEGFTSCGSSDGSGLSGDVVLHISCPAGTKMLYMEPFAAYGGASPYSEAALARMYREKTKPKSYWDGKKTQSKYGKQDETLIQRGTTYKCTDVRRNGGKLHICVQVVSQEPTPIK